MAGNTVPEDDIRVELEAAMQELNILAKTPILKDYSNQLIEAASNLHKINLTCRAVRQSQENAINYINNEQSIVDNSRANSDLRTAKFLFTALSTKKTVSIPSINPTLLSKISARESEQLRTIQGILSEIKKEIDMNLKQRKIDNQTILAKTAATSNNQSFFSRLQFWKPAPPTQPEKQLGEKWAIKVTDEHGKEKPFSKKK